LQHLVNEILEIERRLTSTVDPASAFNFDLHTLDCDRDEDTSQYAKKGEYRLFDDGYVELPTQIEAEDVSIKFERAVTGEHTKFKTTLQHRTWSVEDVAEQMFQRLRSIDDESKDADDPKEQTRYAKKFPRETCMAIVRESLKRAKVKTGRITDENRQKFLQALGTLRRKAAKRVVYRLSPTALQTFSTAGRQAESCSAAELRRGTKTVFYTAATETTLVDEQLEFFREVQDEDGDFRSGRKEIPNAADVKTPANLVITDQTPERKFFQKLRKHDLAEFRSQLDVAVRKTDGAA